MSIKKKKQQKKKDTRKLALPCICGKCNNLGVTGHGQPNTFPKERTTKTFKK